MIDPHNPADLRRLCESKIESRRKLEPFRQEFRAGLEQYVGHNYSDNAANAPVYINLLELAVDVYERQLVGRPPLVTCFTRSPRLRPTGLKLESLINDRLRVFDVHDALQEWVKAALFCLGIIKVAREPSGETEVSGHTIYRHRPFVKSILLDDWVHDMGARTRKEIGYMGHRYRIELEEAMDRGDFDKKAREKLSAIDRDDYNESGDERSSTLQGARGLEENLKRPVELWEIFLPQEQLLVTIPDGSEYERPLKVQEWDGPPQGPFHPLFFKSVPGNTMPLSINTLLRPLHNLVNANYRKSARQAERQKKNTVVGGGDTEDGKKFIDANDGDAIVVNNPSAVQEVTQGGIDQSNFAFALDGINRFSWLAGNLDLLGGLGAQSDTLGQDQLLNANASQRISGMQDAVHIGTRRILQDFGFYLWEDPVESYPVTLQIPGLEFPLDDVLRPEERTHDYYEHEIDIEPFSMKFQSPGQRLNTINALVQQVIMPALPIMQQQGLTFDFQAYLRDVAKYANQPEINEYLKLGAPVFVNGSAGQEVRAPSVSHRENVRTSRSGATRQGSDQTLVNSLMGGNPQASQMAQVGRTG